MKEREFIFQEFHILIKASKKLMPIFVKEIQNLNFFTRMILTHFGFIFHNLNQCITI